MTRPNIFQTFVINPNQNQAIFVINPNQNQVVFVINPNQNLTTFVINPNHPPQKYAKDGRIFVIYYLYSTLYGVIQQGWLRRCGRWRGLRQGLSRGGQPIVPPQIPTRLSVHDRQRCYNNSQ